MLEKISSFVIPMVQKIYTEMTGSQSFKFVASLMDFKRLGQLRIVNKTTVSLFKEALRH